jgi:protein-S-isoprenylcysteine O-methyltransferase Ste14
MAALVRALAYATVFVGFVLVFLPARILDWAGVTRPSPVGRVQIIGAIITVLGAVLALWCVITFAMVGRGTPAPFDPPRRLVVAGPYGYVRNPMYLGAGLALAGAAIFYETVTLGLFLLLFLVATHAFVVLYEEPTLRRSFGDEYAGYCARVDRWLPRRPRVGESSESRRG